MAVNWILIAIINSLSLFYVTSSALEALRNANRKVSEFLIGHFTVNRHFFFFCTEFSFQQVSPF